MSKIELIMKEKAERLSSVPEALYSGIEDFQTFIYETILGLLSELESKNGYFVMSKKNERLIADIRQEMSKVLGGKEYLKTILEFAKEFDQQKKVTDKFFKEMFSDFESTKIGDLIYSQAKQNAIELLTGATPKTGFLSSLEGEITKAITSGASWKDTVKSIRILALGTTDVGKNTTYMNLSRKDGKILQYAKQVSSDALALADRSYTIGIAQTLGSEWFLYFGDELPTSREFCIERHGKYFHKKEVESWASIKWAGKMEDSTNESTIFINCGGWRCQHSLLPVSIDQVPKEVIYRNMSSGNFTPTEFDVKELGLVA